MIILLFPNNPSVTIENPGVGNLITSLLKTVLSPVSLLMAIVFLITPTSPSNCFCWLDNVSGTDTVKIPD